MKKRKTILVVDDEEKIVEVLQAYLKREGYDVLAAYDGATALQLFKENEISLILLDLMLPDMTGERVCRMLRALARIPIIMVTAKTEESDLIVGLDMGADDYIFKPFSPRTVMAKIKAVLRRMESDELVGRPVSYNGGALVIDFDNICVKGQGREVGLTPTEFRVLSAMAKAPQRVFTREQLISCALDNQFEGYDRSIDTYIKGVRSKIEDNRKIPTYILTVHGLGYKFAGERE